MTSAVSKVWVLTLFGDHLQAVLLKLLVLDRCGSQQVSFTAGSHQPLSHDQHRGAIPRQLLPWLLSCFHQTWRDHFVLCQCNDVSPLKIEISRSSRFGSIKSKLFPCAQELHYACSEVWTRKEATSALMCLTRSESNPPMLLCFTNPSTLSTNAPSGSELRTQIPRTLG